MDIGIKKHLKSKKTGLRSWDPRGVVKTGSKISLMTTPWFAMILSTTHSIESAEPTMAIMNTLNYIRDIR